MGYVITAVVALVIGFAGGAAVAYLYTAKVRAAGKAALEAVTAKL